MKLTVDGIEFKGKHYAWSNVKEIRRTDSVLVSWLLYQIGAPLSYIIMNDGTHIKIRGRCLEKEGEKSEVSFFRGVSQTYERLLKFLQEKTEK